MNLKFEQMMKFKKELYSKIALLKAAYNFSDVCYIHLDADEDYYYVSLSSKENQSVVSEEGFIDEMLSQSVRHEVYLQTKNIRELMLARAMASSVMIEQTFDDIDEKELFFEDEILKDWFKGK